MEHHEKHGTGATAGPRMVALLCTDLMFGVRLQNMVRAAGLGFVTLRPGEALPAGDVPRIDMLVVDLTTRGDWEPTIRDAAEQGIPVVAFGPHMDVQARRRARMAGAGRVLANSNLMRDLPPILRQLGAGEP